MRVKAPTPVQVKLVASDIPNTVVEAVVLVSAMLPVPKAIARVLDPEEEKLPVLKLNPARLSVPLVSVAVLVVPSVMASARVYVAPEPVKAAELRVLPLLVIVPEA